MNIFESTKMSAFIEVGEATVRFWLYTFSERKARAEKDYGEKF